MRRLTLILSDLYLPADAVRESFPTAMELPTLQSLLRFAEPPRRMDDWRSWLASELGATAISDWPVAHVSALAAALPVQGTWMATPVALEARLDHVRLRDRGLLRLPLEQQQALQIEFTQVFGAAPRLHAIGAPSLLLSEGPTAEIATHDPARLLDSDIGHALPAASSASGELRRLGAEIEMWLHSSAVNETRERARQPRISSLWLWGGGSEGAPFSGRPLESALHLHGSDHFIHSLRKLAGTATAPAVPAGFADLAVDAPSVVELAPMSGTPAEALLELEQRWFAPARAAMSSGRLDGVTLVANDRVFDLTGRGGWKIWRRQRGWLESLA